MRHSRSELREAFERVVAAKAGDDAPLLERGEDARVRPVAADRLALLARHWHPRSDRRLNLGRSRAIYGKLGRSRASSQRPPPSLELGKSRQISASISVKLGESLGSSRSRAISGPLGLVLVQRNVVEGQRRHARQGAHRLDKPGELGVADHLPHVVLRAEHQPQGGKAVLRSVFRAPRECNG